MYRLFPQDYQKYLNSGMALQYAAVVTRDTVANLIKGIPERGWKTMAEVRLRHAPDRMITDIFDKSLDSLGWFRCYDDYNVQTSGVKEDRYSEPGDPGHVEAHNPT